MSIITNEKIFGKKSIAVYIYSYKILKVFSVFLLLNSGFSVIISGTVEGVHSQRKVGNPYYIKISEFRSFSCGDYHSNLLLGAIYRWPLYLHVAPSPGHHMDICGDYAAKHEIGCGCNKINDVLFCPQKV